MKIIQTPARIFSSGGVERYVGDLSRQLVKRGHHVTIICAQSRTHSAVCQDLEILPLVSIGRIGNTPLTPSLPFHLLKQDFDIIHTHLPTPWSADWSRIVAHWKDRPLVLTYHSAITGRGIARRIAGMYTRTAQKTLFSRASRIILAREAYFPDSLRDFRDKVAYIPIGVDSTRFYPQELEDTSDIFFLSVFDKFHGFKGFESLLSAIQHIKIRIPDVRVVVGGDGPLLPYYGRMAESMGLSKNIHFAGHIPEDRLRDYYNGCSVFVLPSRSPELETFGIVLLEAMACGRPVVTTDIAGMADDIKKTDAGIVVKVDDREALANAILKILQDKSLGRMMGSCGRRLVEEKYRWETVTEKIEQLYKDIL
ncbi:MAG: glycosyltransferase family 4 protein [Methanoregulaceae archaeon]|jgi:glycosyltransferase involved in cell wall biosynthesis|nr:glycosyltransferase family 4 protein [Methanoregulaceae archaeon]